MGVETKAGKKADHIPALKVQLVRHSPEKFNHCLQLNGYLLAWGFLFSYINSH